MNTNRSVPPRTLWTTRWRVLLAGALATGATGLLAASCSSAHSSLPGGGSCTNGGQSCPHGCVAGVGCAQCGVDGDCNLNAPFCVLGACVPCRSSSNCAVGQACSPAQHTCGPKCTANANCAPNAPICDTASGACVGCETSKDCPTTTPVCPSSTLQCSQCGGNSDCSATDPVCDLADGRCVQCLVDADCPEGYLCDAPMRQCHVGCKTNADCGGGARPICETSTGACVGCASSTDCGAAAPICTSAGDCVQCETKADCKTATTPLCTMAGMCVECTVDTDCKAPTPVCNNNVCAQCAGAGQSTCPTGMRCRNGTCL